MNRSSFFRLFYRLLLFTFFIIIMLAVTYWVVPGWYHPWIWAAVLFLFTVSLAGIAYIELKSGQNTDRFTVNFFLVMLGRLLLSIIFLAAALFLDRENASIFVLTFMILYLFYLGFEIYYLIRKLQPRTGNGNFDGDS